MAVLCGRGPGQGIAAGRGGKAFPGGLFVPYFLFLAIMAAFHYAYYHRETKSIYLMRRLPRRSVLVASCVRAPLLGMAVGAAAEAVLGVIYYGIYLLVMPGVCAPGFW